MVFSSIPVYLDPPNWQPQQGNPEPGRGVLTNNEVPQLQQVPPAPGPGATGSIRPGSMTDRARVAKIPMPEAGLKCPRCESTNTKFCYFNNYSLTQPRHFCKACRRYWTRGGALRNIPVGGGCRRNKRSKGNNRLKSPAVMPAASSSTTSGGCGGISSASTGVKTSSADVIIGHNLPPLGSSQLSPFLPLLYNLNDLVPSNIGLNFETSRKVGSNNMEFLIGNATNGGGEILPNGIANRQWGLQQFPSLSNDNLQASPQVGFYPLEGAQGTLYDYQLLPKPSDSTQISSVKMEEANQGLNLSRNFAGVSGSVQYWKGSSTGTGNAWGNDLSHGFSSTSMSHLLCLLCEWTRKEDMIKDSLYLVITTY